MKIFFLIAISISFFGFRLFSDIYSYSFNTIDGEQKSISLYQGKKILILVLPSIIRNGDTSYLHLVGEAGAMHKQNLVIIAVPSIEDGYTASGAGITKQWYKKHTGENMVIASPM